MKRLRIFERAVVLLVAAGALVTVAGTVALAQDDQATEALNRGIRLFEEGQYQLAQEVLLDVDRNDLNAAQKTLRDEYVERSQVAVTMAEKATQDLEDCEAAIDDGDLQLAEMLCQAVLDNEFASQVLREAALAGRQRVEDLRRESPEALMELETATPAPAAPVDVQVAGEGGDEMVIIETVEEVVQEPAPMEVAPMVPAADQAASLTDQGYEAMDAGRDAEAEELFRQALSFVAGFPEAKAGLLQLSSRKEVEARAGSLLSRLRERDRVNWQRTVANYREAEADVRELAMDERFTLASQALLRARQVVESGRQYADPVTKYEALLDELSALQRYIAEEERRFNEVRVRKTRRDVMLQEQSRQRKVEKARRRQIEEMMFQASEHRKDGDYESAIRVLREITTIDPTNQQAEGLLDTLEDAHQLILQRSYKDERARQAQKVLTDVEETKIPWHEMLRYPKNWLEIVSRSSGGAGGGESLLDQQLFAKLDRHVPVQFHNTPLDAAITALASAQNVNVSVNWADLDTAGIKPNTPVTLALATEIPLRRALDEVLDLAGGSRVELGYTARDGLVKIATQDKLDREVYVAVYDVGDLLVPRSNFSDAPKIDLPHQARSGLTQGLGTTIYRKDNANDRFADDERDDRYYAARQERVAEIIDLIRTTVEPHSWQANGGEVAAIDEFNGQLVVTQTSAAQRSISDLLSQLREQATIQVNVEAIFLQINSNYMEELGLDIDIVLNQGNAGFDQTGSFDAITGSQILLPRSASRLGFIPATPTVGTPLTQTGFTTTGGAIGTPAQPFGNAALVPPRGQSFIQSSRSTPVPFISSFLDLVTPTSTDIEGSFGGGDMTPALSIFGSFLDNIQVDFLLRATQADRRNTVLTAPRITLTNGQRSWVGVITQQAFISSLLPVVDQNAVAVQPIIGIIETGTVLDVEATVSANKRYVTLTLRPGVGRLVGAIPTFPFGAVAGGAGFVGFIQTPTVQRQVLKTTVTVPDGGTLMFGGLKLAADTEVEAGVPILSKIPILKRLYSASSLVKDESVLMILVKPRIIIQSEAEGAAFPGLASR